MKNKFLKQKKTGKVTIRPSSETKKKTGENDNPADTKKIKGFDKKQMPIAIAAVVIVIAVIITVLVCAPGSKNKKEKTKTTTKQSQTTKTESTTTTTEDVNTTKEAAVDYQMSGSVLLVGKSAMENYYIAEGSLTSYGQLLSAFAAKIPDKTVYVCLAPTSVEFNGPEAYRTGAHSQAKGISIAYKACTGSNIKTVDACGTLAKHTAEYLYFRTDHHWTQRGAYYAYKALGAAAGFTATDIKSMKTVTIDDSYLGTLYGYSDKAQILADNPDYIEGIYPLKYSTASGMIYKDSSLTNGTAFTIINAEASSYAAAFCSGDQPIEVIKTGNTNGKKIAVIKNSFGNAFIPFLIDNYQEIYVIDPRSVSMSLKDFVTNNGIQEIVFLTNTMAPSISAFMTPLKTMLA